MKTEILLPNPVFEASEQLAQILNVTEILNQVYESEPSSIDPALINMQIASLGDKQW